MRKYMSQWKKLICILCAAMILFLEGPTKVQAEVYWPEGPSITTPCAIVMEVNSGAILYEKDSDRVSYPASITKILTTLLAIENSQLDEVVVFSEDAIHETPRDSSHIWRDIGEEMTMEECLYAVMLESANECAYAVAEHVGEKLGGGYQTFIDLMNERVQELGCKNTHFTNSNGLPDENHVTTPRDMALIAADAYRNETFRIITGTPKYQIPPTNKHPEVTYLSNHHRMLHAYKSPDYVYEYSTGGKTGYTVAAGSTLVSFAEKDGLSLVCVVMRTNSPSQWTDTRTLFEYCFQNFKPYVIAENETTVMDNGTSKGIMNNHEAYVDLDKDAYIVLPATADFSDAEFSLMSTDLTGNTIAQLQYTYGGRAVGSVDIVPSGVEVGDSYFDYAKQREEESEVTVVRVKPITIVIILILLVIIALAAFFGKRLYDNYYMILHDFEVRRQRRERFRPVSQKKRRWRKRDRMFK